MIDAATVAELGLPGHLRSVPDEIDATELTVTGALPPELNGRYIRNGPNALPGAPGGLVQAGPGMLHGVRLRDGRAEWYRNRWIRTGAFAGRPFITSTGRPDRTAVSANTHVVGHAGRMFALVEVGLPYEVTPELATLGPCDFDGRLTTAMTAHPKRDPVTGELHFFGYGARPPFLTYHRLNAKGELIHSREVPVPASTMMHDFAITHRHAVWLDLPLTFRLGGPGMPYGWNDRHQARIGLMRHDIPDAPVRWFDIGPCFVLHTANAHEEPSGRVIVDAVRYSPAEFAKLWELMSGTLTGRPASGTLHRWTLDPESGTATEQALDDQEVEFPTFDDDRMGRRARYLYTVTGTDPRSSGGHAIIRYDRAYGQKTAYELGPDAVTGEAVFVPAAGPGTRDEADGWLISITTRTDGSASRLLVLDATDLAAGPVATVDLPRAVPTGFHGTWFPS